MCESGRLADFAVVLGGDDEVESDAEIRVDGGGA